MLLRFFLIVSNWSSFARAHLLWVGGSLETGWAWTTIIDCSLCSVNMTQTYICRLCFVDRVSVPWCLTPHTSALIHVIWRITARVKFAVYHQLEEIERAAVKCLLFHLGGKWAGSTSILSWLKSILLKDCLFWAQTQNSNVSDGLGNQINRLILTVVFCLFIWAICACCSCQTNQTRFHTFYV